MQKNSTWLEAVNKKSYPRLSKDSRADILIVGGGIAGVLSAYLLSKAGKQVVLLEKGEIGNGVTAVTTAFLTQSIDTDSVDLIKAFGFEKALAVIDSHGAAIDLIEKIVREENIDCDFERCSNFIYANSEKEIEDLQKELEAGRKLGLKADFFENNRLGFKNSGFVEIKNQAKFHPLKFVYALAEKAVANGVQIFEHTPAKKIAEKIKDTKGLVQAETTEHSVTADWALVTTYEPFNKPLKLYFKKAFYTSYVFEVEIDNSATGMAFAEGIYEDTNNPYHYLRIEKNTNKTYRIIIGGEDHRSDVPVSPEKSFNALKEYLDTILSDLTGLQYVIKKQWTGPILESVDGLAYVGPIRDENILYAMAFSGNGMTYSAISATLFTDYIFGRENGLKEIYAAHRIPTLKSLFTKGKDYSEELAKGAIKNTFTQNDEPVRKRWTSPSKKNKKS